MSNDDLPTSRTATTPISSTSKYETITAVTASTSTESAWICEYCQYAGIVIQLLAFIPCVLGNLFVFIAVCKFRKLRTKSNMYILSLAVADFAAALIIIPMNTAIVMLPQSEENSELYTRFVLVCLLGASLSSMLLISADRYLAISHPFYYKEKITHCRIAIAIGLTWTVTLALASPNIYFVHFNFGNIPPEYSITVYVIMLIVYLANIGLYLWVARVALQQYKRIGSEISYNNPAAQTDLHNTKLMVTIFGTFILCWLGLVIITTLYVSKQCAPTKDDESRFTSKHSCSIAWRLCVSVALVNSALNCYIHAWKKRDFTWARQQMMCKIKVDNKQLQTGTTNHRRNNSGETTFVISQRAISRRVEMSVLAYTNRLAEVGSETDIA